MNEIDKINFQKRFTPIKQIDYQQRFQDKLYLNKGSYSQVSKAIDVYKKSPVAIKEFKPLIFRINSVYRDIIRQIQILELLKQFPQRDYFLTLFDKFRVENQHKVIYCLVTELCDCSFDKIFFEPEKLQKFSQLERLKFCVQISDGLRILHENKIIHRDLKPGNIFLKYKNNQPMIVIGDFNQSKQNDLLMTQCRGSPQYVDPYLFETNNYSLEWDVYSFGLIMLEMLTGKFIIDSPQQHYKSAFFEIMKKILQNLNQNLKRFQLQPQIKKIIYYCLNRKQRWSIKKIFEKLKNLYEQKLKQEEKKKMKNGKGKQQKIDIEQRKLDEKKKTEQIMKKTTSKKENVIDLNRKQSNYEEYTKSERKNNCEENTPKGKKANDEEYTKNDTKKKNINDDDNTPKGKKANDEEYTKDETKTKHKNQKKQSQTYQKQLTPQKTQVNFNNQMNYVSKQLKLQTNQSSEEITKTDIIPQKKSLKYNEMFGLCRPQNKILFSSKLLQVSKNLDKNTKIYELDTKEIQQLNEIVNNLKKIKELQKIMNFADQDTKLLLITFAYLNIRAKIKQFENKEQKERRGKFTNEFQLKMEETFSPILTYSRLNLINYLRQSGKKVLKQNNSSKYVIQSQYSHLAQNTSCSLSYSQLLQIIH